jgi:hypothetical protein
VVLVDPDLKFMCVCDYLGFHHPHLEEDAEIISEEVYQFISSQNPLELHPKL